MAFQKNKAGQFIAVFAWDTVNNVPFTGDAANITAFLDKDAAGAVQTNDVNPTEADATDLQGWYYFTATKAESNADIVLLSAVSSTANILIDDVLIYTSDDETRLDRNADLIESQRGMWTWSGNYFYVDPINGDTHANGNRGGRLDPYADVQDCHGHTRSGTQGVRRGNGRRGSHILALRVRPRQSLLSQREATCVAQL